MRVTVQVFPAEDVPGQWVAHVIELDLITQGNSLRHALEMAGEAIEIVTEEPAKLESLQATSPPTSWADRPTEHDAEILKAHPLATGNHARYGRAFAMVEARNSKYALVDLVNWLLTRIEA